MRCRLASWKCGGDLKSENKSSIIHCRNFYCYPLLTEGENCSKLKLYGYSKVKVKQHNSNRTSPNFGQQTQHGDTDAKLIKSRLKCVHFTECYPDFCHIVSSQTADGLLGCLPSYLIRVRGKWPDGERSRIFLIAFSFSLFIEKRHFHWIQSALYFSFPAFCW